MKPVTHAPQGRAAASNDNVIRFPTERTQSAKQARAWLVFDAARRELLRRLDEELQRKAAQERGES